VPLVPARLPRALLLRHAALAACAAFLVAHALWSGFVTDDAYISFVFSRNLAEHGQLVFNLGDRVEGFTNFLWTVLIAGAMALGLPPEPTSIALGVGFGVATLVVTLRWMEHIGGGPSGWDLLPAALLALSAGFACWSSGGLETQLFTFLVAFALYACCRADAEPRWFRRAGAALALAAMTRPEGLLVVAVVGAHRLAWNLARERRIVPTRGELELAAAFLALWAPYFAWRWWYYGFPFPNTYYVKAAGDAPPGYREKLLGNGLYYVATWARQTGALWAAPIALLGALGARPRSRRFYAGTLAVWLALVYLAYTASVGGDFMGLHRFVMPVFVLAAIAFALGLRWLIEQVRDAELHRVAACVAAVWALGAHADGQLALSRESMRWGNFAADRGIDTPAFLRVYTEDRATIGRFMAPCMRDTDFAILGGAGAKPYYGRMRGIDVFGLVSEQIAHEVPPTNPRAGHNKWAPDGFLLRHQPPPTFVFSCYSIHADPGAPHFNCNPAFWKRHGYETVTLHIPGLRQQGEYYSFMARADRAFSCP
jgi:hypothetical protein